MQIVTIPDQFSRDPHHCGGIYWKLIERPAPPRLEDT